MQGCGGAPSGAFQRKANRCRPTPCHAAGRRRERGQIALVLPRHTRAAGLGAARIRNRQQLTMAARHMASRSSTVVGSTAVSTTPNAPAPASGRAHGAGAVRLQDRWRWRWWEPSECPLRSCWPAVTQTQPHNCNGAQPSPPCPPAAVPAVLSTASRTSSSSITSAGKCENGAVCDEEQSCERGKKRSAARPKCKCGLHVETATSAATICNAESGCKGSKSAHQPSWGQRRHSHQSADTATSATMLLCTPAGKAA